MSKKTGLILASNSPRRRQLLSLTGLDFHVQPADVDESLFPGEQPWEYVLRLAQEKAREAAAIVGGSEIVLAADTIVVDQDAILGKPVDSQEAASMLRGLRGHTHQVYTGLALCSSHCNHMLTDICIVDVPMRDFSDEEMDTYITTGDSLDKAGAYAIQHDGFQPVEKMQGCFAGVMGLPLCHLTRRLKQMEVNLLEDIPTRCQAELNYECPVWQEITKDQELVAALPTEGKE